MSTPLIGILIFTSILVVVNTQSTDFDDNEEGGETTEQPLSGVEAEFDQCCWESFVNAQCGDGWCRYPPPVPELWSTTCMAVNNVIASYIPCYAQHKDNTACCVQRGVEGKYAVCQDLCNGNATHYTYNLDYFSLCEDVREAVSSCNSGINSTNAEESTSTTRAEQ